MRRAEAFGSTCGTCRVDRWRVDFATPARRCAYAPASTRPPMAMRPARSSARDSQRPADRRRLAADAPVERSAAEKRRAWAACPRRSRFSATTDASSKGAGNERLQPPASRHGPSLGTVRPGRWTDLASSGVGERAQHPARGHQGGGSEEASRTPGPKSTGGDALLRAATKPMKTYAASGAACCDDRPATTYRSDYSLAIHRFNIGVPPADALVAPDRTTRRRPAPAGATSGARACIALRRSSRLRTASADWTGNRSASSISSPPISLAPLTARLRYSRPSRLSRQVARRIASVIPGRGSSTAWSTRSHRAVCGLKPGTSSASILLGLSRGPRRVRPASDEPSRMIRCSGATRLPLPAQNARRKAQRWSPIRCPALRRRNHFCVLSPRRAGRRAHRKATASCSCAASAPPVQGRIILADPALAASLGKDPQEVPRWGDHRLAEAVYRKPRRDAQGGTRAAMRSSRRPFLCSGARPDYRRRRGNLESARLSRQAGPFHRLRCCARPGRLLADAVDAQQRAAAGKFLCLEMQATRDDKNIHHKLNREYSPDQIVDMPPPDDLALWPDFEDSDWPWTFLRYQYDPARELHIRFGLTADIVVGDLMGGDDRAKRLADWAGASVTADARVLGADARTCSSASTHAAVGPCPFWRTSQLVAERTISIAASTQSSSLRSQRLARRAGRLRPRQTARQITRQACEGPIDLALRNGWLLCRRR